MKAKPRLRKTTPFEELLDALGDTNKKPLIHLRNAFLVWREKNNTALTALTRNLMLHLVATILGDKYGPEYFSNTEYGDRLIARVQKGDFGLDKYFWKGITFTFAQPPADAGKYRRGDRSGTGRELRRTNYLNICVADPDSGEGSIGRLRVGETTYYLRRMGGEFPIGNDALKHVPLLFAMIGDPRFMSLLKEEAKRKGPPKKKENVSFPGIPMEGLSQEVLDGLRDLGIDPKTLEDCVGILDHADGLKKGDLSGLAYAMDDANRSSPMNWLYRQFNDGMFADYPAVADAFVNVYYAPEQARPFDFEILKAAVVQLKPEGKGRILNLIEDIRWIGKLEQDPKREKLWQKVREAYGGNTSLKGQIKIINPLHLEGVPAEIALEEILKKCKVPIGVQASVFRHFPGYRAGRELFNRGNINSYLGEGDEFKNALERVKKVVEGDNPNGYHLPPGQKGLLKTFVQAAERNSLLLPHAPSRHSPRESSIQNITFRDSSDVIRAAALWSRKYQLQQNVSGIHREVSLDARLPWEQPKDWWVNERYVLQEDVNTSAGSEITIPFREAYGRISKSFIDTFSSPIKGKFRDVYWAFRASWEERLKYETAAGLIPVDFVKRTKGGKSGRQKPSIFENLFEMVRDYVPIHDNTNEAGEAAAHLRPIASLPANQMKMMIGTYRLYDILLKSYVSPSVAQTIIRLDKRIKENGYSKGL
ncbi:hypothetical protein HYV84_04115 [Candidatus Woesearchaeota archaeon]|nr:hypothetical protein [Candidatus Woesearchaeota archaeon]